MRLSRRNAFTIVEVLLAVSIFSLIILGIYATWNVVVQGSRAGVSAAASAQRARISIRAIEDALLTVQMFNANVSHYAFQADVSGDYGSLSFVSHLPASFPGVGRYGDQFVRRVSFSVEPGDNRQNNLVMRQGPMLVVGDQDFEPYSLVLAKDVTLFAFEFYDQQRNEWVQEWNQTNQLPKIVKVAIGLGQAGKSGQPQDLVIKTVAIPATAVQPEWQSSGPGGAIGRPGPGAGQPPPQPGPGGPNAPSLPPPGRPPTFPGSPSR